MKATITSIETNNKPWEGPNGALYFHVLTLEGEEKRCRIATKTATTAWLREGEELEYEVTGEVDIKNVPSLKIKRVSSAAYGGGGGGGGYKPAAKKGYSNPAFEWRLSRARSKQVSMNLSYASRMLVNDTYVHVTTTDDVVAVAAFMDDLMDKVLLKIDGMPDEDFIKTDKHTSFSTAMSYAVDAAMTDTNVSPEEGIGAAFKLYAGHMAATLNRGTE